MMAIFAFVTLPTWVAILWRRLRFGGGKRTTPSRQVGSILVVRLDQLGDLVLTTPLFRELKRLYPGVKLTLVVKAQYAALCATNPNVDEIVPLAEWKIAFLPRRARWLFSVAWCYWSRLRRCRFDLAISPRWDLDEDLATMLCVLVDAKQRGGYGSREPAAKRWLNAGFAKAWDVLVPAQPMRHEVDRNLAVAAALGGANFRGRAEIFLITKDLRAADRLLRNHQPYRSLVAVGIGGRTPGRRWPLRRYAELLTRLNEERPVQPVIVCSAAEAQDASTLSLMLSVPPYILSGVPLRTVCAVLERCDVFVGNDTGTAHLAAAMYCPTVVISRHPANGDPEHANSPERFRPLGAWSRVLQPEAGIGSCRASCREPEPHCILEVTVDSVLAAVREIMLDLNFEAPPFAGNPAFAAPEWAAEAEVSVQETM